MKRVFDKKILLGIIIGGLFFGTASVSATLFYHSDQVSYKKNDDTEVDVKTALDELYNIASNNVDESSIVSIGSSYTIPSDGTYYIIANTYGGWVDGQTSRSVTIKINLNGTTVATKSSTLTSATFSHSENVRPWYMGAPSVTYKGELKANDVIAIARSGNATLGSFAAFAVKVR